MFPVCHSSRSVFKSSLISQEGTMKQDRSSATASVHRLLDIRRLLQRNNKRQQHNALRNKPWKLIEICLTCRLWRRFLVRLKCTTSRLTQFTADTHAIAHQPLTHNCQHTQTNIYRESPFSTWSSVSRFLRCFSSLVILIQKSGDKWHRLFTVHMPLLLITM